METFIVLGLCFILYEALDLFQSCYNRPNHHQPLHHQQNGDGGLKDINKIPKHSQTVDSKDTARLILDVISEISDSGGGGSGETDSEGSINEDSHAIVDNVTTKVAKVFSISDTVECGAVAPPLAYK